MFLKSSHKDAFDVIAIELGFMYDLLYTKAKVLHTPWGLARRVISSSLTCIVLLIFSFAYKSKYFKVDLSITFLLLAVAIILEIYAAFSLILSDWANLGFRSKNFPILRPMITWLEPVVKLPRWSESIRQYSILRLCLKEKSSIIKIPELLHLDRIWEEHRCKTVKQVPEDLIKLIFKHVLKKYDAFKADKDQDKYSRRGIHALHKYYGENSPFDWSIKGIEFDQSILIWHIATELCYYSDTESNFSDILDYTNRKISKLLSRYMLNLLVIYPSLLSVGIGLIRFRDTRSETKKFLEERMHNYLTSKSHGLKIGI